MSYAEGIDHKLDLCAFCGGTASATYVGNDRSKKRSITVKCSVCRVRRTDAALRHGFDWLEDIAIKGWNQRPPLALSRLAASEVLCDESVSAQLREATGI